MLDKLVVHLKNILFFKAIIYVLTIIILISVVAPILTNDLKQAVSRQEQSKLSLKQAKHKLASIADFEQNIASTNLHFNELVARPTNAGCFNRNDFVNRLQFLEKKYHLIPPLAINITRIFEEKTAKKHNKQVKINSYRAIITFQTNKENVLQITQDICTTLPAGAIITDIEIKKISVITPSFVKSLSTQNVPGLFQVTVGAHLREIVYEK